MARPYPTHLTFMPTPLDVAESSLIALKIFDVFSYHYTALLQYQPLTDGICDDVLDVVEGIDGETVIELTQEENNM
jgi:hypothetical protein